MPNLTRGFFDARRARRASLMLASCPIRSLASPPHPRRCDKCKAEAGDCQELKRKISLAVDIMLRHEHRSRAAVPIAEYDGLQPGQHGGHQRGRSPALRYLDQHGPLAMWR